MLFLSFLISGFWWPMFQHDVWHSAIQEGRGEFTQLSDMEISWLIYSPGLDLRGAPVTEDVNGDSRTEVVFTKGDTLCVVRGSDGTFLWKKYLYGNMKWTTPVIGDMDGDSEVEIFVTTDNGDAFLLKGTDGTEEWNVPIYGEAKYNSAVFGDVDGDGIPRIFIGTKGGKFYCFKGNTGEILWEHTFSGDYVNSSPALADVDKDGREEVIVHTFYGKVICFDAVTGNEKWNFSFTEYYGFSSPSLGDVDDDGLLEIAVASDGGALYLLGSDGTLKWSFVPGVYIDMTPIIVDIEGDGEKEVIVGTSWGDEKVYCLKGTTGEIEWSVDYSGYNPGKPSSSVADINGDGKLEVIVAAEVSGFQGGIISVIDCNGNELWRYENPPYLAVNWSFKGPTISDVNDDGVLDILWTSGLYPGWDHDGYLIALLSPSIPWIKAEVYICPRTLNLHSRGKWVMAFIELPSPYKPEDIDISTLTLRGPLGEVTPGEITELRDHDRDGIPELMVKFVRDEVKDIVEPGWNTLVVEGLLVDGTSFMGTDTIRVIDIPRRERRRMVKIEPNPFTNGDLRIEIESGEELSKDMMIRIYDLSGRVVKWIPVNWSNNVYFWDGRDAQGREIKPGVYFIEIGGDVYRVIKL